jgi:hypothetical protein
MWTEDQAFGARRQERKNIAALEANIFNIQLRKWGNPDT